MSYRIGTGWWILWYYAVTPKQPMPHRWAAQLLASALGLVLLSLHATWRFRYR